MKQYKVSYDVRLRPGGGGFCTSPLEIMQQMGDAQKKTMRALRDFLTRENLQDQVRAIVPLQNENAIVLQCGEEVAEKLKRQSFVSGVAEYQPAPAQKPGRKPPPFRF
ncbi:MAG: hypothetical protein GC185_00990 [Alphaproteobacteria bacterium]|nr:hypothetical protein [Alphaproteobacteria bacterium]